MNVGLRLWCAGPLPRHAEVRWHDAEEPGAEPNVEPVEARTCPHH